MGITRRYRVHGRVQGVGFRYFVQRTASTVGVRGWVRNRVDGTVEVLAQGSEDDHRRLEEGLREGPRMGRVDRLDVEDEPASDLEEGFSIRRDR